MMLVRKLIRKLEVTEECSCRKLGQENVFEVTCYIEMRRFRGLYMRGRNPSKRGAMTYAGLCVCGYPCLDFRTSRAKLHEAACETQLYVILCEALWLEKSTIGGAAKVVHVQ
jgi:hypothetical protein